jgi:hypothetical protein
VPMNFTSTRPNANDMWTINRWFIDNSLHAKVASSLAPLTPLLKPASTIAAHGPALTTSINIPSIRSRQF